MTGDIAHICNRGVKKHVIFIDDKDRIRFILNLYRLNNKSGYLRITNQRNPFENLPEQNKLVEVLKWSLMPNHYHLLLYEKKDGGIVEFVKRLGNAYTKYINIKNSTSGYVFQNSAKIILITKNPHYLYIPFYIDLNPLDLISGWKSGKMKPDKAINFLKKYKWSSYRDYFGKESEFLPILNRKLFYRLFDTNHKSYQREALDLIKKDDLLDFAEHVNLAG